MQEFDVMKTQPTQSLVEAIRGVMESRGLTIQQLADKAGIKRPVLSVILNGHQSPTQRTIERIADGLDLTFVCAFVDKPTKSKKRSA